MINLKHGDCLEQMRLLPDNSVDSIVTDPPYGISFMGKKWDYDVPSKEVFSEMLRVLKPGGHALIACGTRTQHRMAVNIEDAGFEIRDVITWLYGSGFPKSMDISKAIDKQAGAEREVLGINPSSIGRKDNKGKAAGFEGKYSEQENPRQSFLTAPATDAAKQWQGWGTALKPACEFWTLARKPLSEKTVAANVLKHGTGGINIDGCRIGTQTIKTNGGDKFQGKVFGKYNTCEESFHQGRWPANLILDEEGAKVLDEQVSKTMKMHGAGNKKTRKAGDGKESNSMFGIEAGAPTIHYDHGEDSSKASRFFYVAKASKSERNQGLDHFPKKEVHSYGSGIGEGLDPNAPSVDSNFHPTVKPIKLMTYLCRLITPPNGIVLDPFMGSGSTGVAAAKEGFGFVGIEREEQYFEICKARISHE